MALSAGAATGLMALYFVAVRTLRGQIFERVAANGRSLQPFRVRGAAWLLLDTISVGSLALTLFVILGMALRRHRNVAAFAVATVVFGSVATTELLKLVILKRPDLAVQGDPNSFPSGHTTVAVSIVVAGLLLVPFSRRGLMAMLGASYAIGIGTATVIVGWHRPSDVLGAWLVVGAWTFAALAYLSDGTETAAKGDRVRGATWWLIAGLIALVVMFIFGLAATTYIGLDRQATGRLTGERIALAKRAVAFGFSMSAVAALAVFLIALLLQFLPGVSTRLAARSAADPKSLSP